MHILNCKSVTIVMIHEYLKGISVLVQIPPNCCYVNTLGEYYYSFNTSLYLPNLPRLMHLLYRRTCRHMGKYPLQVIFLLHTRRHTYARTHRHERTHTQIQKHGRTHAHSGTCAKYEQTHKRTNKSPISSQQSATL